MRQDQEYPAGFHAAVRTLMLCAQHRSSDHQPYHPQSPLSTLPFDVLELIIRHLAREWLLLQVQETVEKRMALDAEVLVR